MALLNEQWKIWQVEEKKQLLNKENEEDKVIVLRTMSRRNVILIVLALPQDQQ
jgi:hypothetical protein